MKTKRLVSLLLTLCMLLSVVPMMGITASAEAVTPPTADSKADFLKFESDAAFTIRIGTINGHQYEGKLWYSTDKAVWTEAPDNTAISAGQNGGKYVLYFAGKGNTVITGPTPTGGLSSLSYIWNLSSSGDIYASGNIMTLLDYANPDNVTMGAYAFQYMFFGKLGWSRLITAPKLPATTLAEHCYDSMFWYCTALETAPELPAKVMASNCYYSMFYGCSSLVSAPALPAETLATGCYMNMFCECSSLITAPALPATALAADCYRGMFGFCTSLTSVPDLSATSLAEGCYLGMFDSCTSLTSLPDLPATTLPESCYTFMFSGCTGIRLTTTDQGCGSWSGIPSNATFIGVHDFMSYMIDGTGGDYTSTPEIGVTYYYMAPNYVEFSSDASFTVQPNGNWDGTLYYSTNGADWQTVTKGETISSSTDFTLYFRGKDNTVITGGNNPWILTPTDGHKIYAMGDICSLADYEKGVGSSEIVTEDEFYENDELQSAYYYYSYYLSKIAEELGAIGSYEFNETKDESEYPGNTYDTYTEYLQALSGISLGDSAFEYMFAGQSSLVSLPTLSVKKLSDNCYAHMFDGCTGIRIGETDNALGFWTGIPSDATTGTDSLAEMFANTSGTYTEAPVLGTKYYYELPAAVKNATYNASLTLDADIDLTFTMGSLGTDGNGTGFDQSKLKITVDGTEWTGYTYKNGELSGTLASVAPQNIGNELHIVITYDGIVIKDFNYSVKAYCDAVFKAYTKDNTTYAKLNTLCEALLNYGKWAEDYYNERNSLGKAASTLNTGHEATFDDYTFTGVKDASTFLGDYAGEGSEAYLALGSTIKLNFLLKNCSEALVNDDPETQNFFVLNDKAEPEQIDPDCVKITTKGNDTIVSVDLYASQLATSYTLKLKGVDTKDFCITYGVYNYCSAAQGLLAKDGFTDTVKTLCKAIHNYSVAVQAYIDSTAK